MIRSASTADAPQIADVMRDSWFAGYDGIIAPAMIDQATAPDGGARVRQSFRIRPWQRMIAAVARGPAQVVQARRRPASHLVLEPAPADQLAFADQLLI